MNPFRRLGRTASKKLWCSCGFNESVEANPFVTLLNTPGDSPMLPAIP